MQEKVAHKPKKTSCRNCRYYSKKDRFCSQLLCKIRSVENGSCNKFIEKTETQKQKEYLSKEKFKEKLKCKFKKMNVTPEQAVLIYKNYFDEKTKVKDNGNKIIYLLPRDAIMIAEYKKELDKVEIILRGPYSLFTYEEIKKLIKRKI